MKRAGQPVDAGVRERGGLVQQRHAPHDAVSAALAFLGKFLYAAGAIHRTIKKVGQNIENLTFNTVLATHDADQHVL